MAASSKMTINDPEMEMGGLTRVGVFAEEFIYLLVNRYYHTGGFYISIEPRRRSMNGWLSPLVALISLSGCCTLSQVKSMRILNNFT